MLCRYNVPIFEITILYKSGNKHSFRTSLFKMADQRVEWFAIDNANEPIKIGYDDIEAVYQTGAWKVGVDIEVGIPIENDSRRIV